MGCKRAYAPKRVTKIGYVIGVRSTMGRSRDVRGTPDVTVDDLTSGRRLIDAKYKLGSDSAGQSGAPQALISSGDMYEALAFMEGASVDTIFLVYPSRRGVGDKRGNGQPLEVVTVANRKINAVSVGVNGIAGLGGYRQFCDTIRELTDRQ